MSESHSRHPWSDVDRAVCATTFSLGTAAWNYFIPTNMWIAGFVFLLGAGALFAALGIAFGSWQIGAVIGIATGLAYLAWIFTHFANGGYYPDSEGWPIILTVAQSQSTNIVST